MSFNYSPKIITDGLVLYLDAANKRSYPGSGTIWSDLSKNGNNGTLTNGPTFNSANGGSIVFDGTNDYIDCGVSTSLNITGSITTDMWVNYSSTNNTLDGSLIGKYSNSGGSTNQAWIVFLSTSNYQSYGPGNTGPLSGELGWLASSNGNFNGALIGSGEQIYINTWYNFVTIYDSGNDSLLIYINGSLKRNVVRTGQTSGLLATGSRSVQIGGTLSDNIRWVQGKIPISRIYNRALSASEVLQNYNATKTRFRI